MWALTSSGKQRQAKSALTSFRPDRVGHRPVILGELHLTHRFDVLDPLDGFVRGIRREANVAVHGQAFLEGQLEPIPARDTVARPVVEVLVGNDPFNTSHGRIRRRRWQGEDALGVEDVEALVFHGTHVEVGHGHDIEKGQVVLAPKLLLIPSHGLLDALHRKAKLIDELVFRVDADLYILLAPFGGKPTAQESEVPRHQGKQIRWLWERVLVGSKVPSIG